MNIFIQQMLLSLHPSVYNIRTYVLMDLLNPSAMNRIRHKVVYIKYIYTHIYIYVYISTYIYVCIWIYKCLYTCMYMYAYVYIRIYIYVCICIYKLIYLYACLHTSIYICMYMHAYVYLRTYIFTNCPARAGCDTRSVFNWSLTCLNSEFSFSLTGCLTKDKEHCLSNYLPIYLPNYSLSIAGERIIGFRPFTRVLALCEMHIVSSRIWTRVAVSISYDGNHYTTA